MAKKIKVGIIGIGRIGKLHGENLIHVVKNVEVVAIADPYLTQESIEWAENLGIKKQYKDAEEIFKDESIEAVFICSATHTHADFIIQAARYGKHIFCEKPIDTDLAKIKEAIAAVEKAKVKLQVGFVRRFDHNHKKVHDTVQSQVLGKPHIIKITSRDPDHQPMAYIEISGGIYLDMSIHDFDMARYLAGSDVVEVSAFGTVLSDQDYAAYNDVDTTIIMLKFANGALGVIDNSRAAHYGYDQRTEVHGDKGCVQVANDFCDTAMISTAEGVSLSKPTWFFLERYNNAFISEAQEFINAVLQDTETIVDGRDGLMAVVIAIAAEKSLKEQRPVKLKEIDASVEYK